jgi:hypothetical protein
MTIDQDKLTEFLHKFVGDLGATMAAGNVLVGDRLGLYRALAAQPMLPTDAHLLGEPIGGRLLFAGERTQSARMAYADGAMTSGIREAKRLLGQPGVRLGPIRTAPR